MNQDELNRLYDVSSDALRTAIRSTLASFASDQAIPSIDIEFPLPISRASCEDYVRIAGLWKEYHGHQPIDFQHKGSLSASIARFPFNLFRPTSRPLLSSRDCPGCGSKRHRQRFVSHDLYPFHVCEDCATLFVPWSIEEDFIERFFVAVPEARQIADRMMAGRDRVTEAADHQRFDAYFALAEALAGGAQPSFRYLDIGCGVGHSIDAATERGYEAVGLEISRTALATAQSRGRQCFHPDEWQGQNDFQLVSLFETLEHVADPLAMLTGARDRLAKNGLIIITVPNGASWEISVLSERCVHVYGGFDGVGHINLLTPKGIAALLRRAGFEPLLFDGQFSNNPLLLLSGMMDVAQKAMEPTGDGKLTSRLPASVYRLLSNSGPMLTAIDRAILRSPITIALACRAEDSEHFQTHASKLEAKRRRAIVASIPESPPEPSSEVAIPQDSPLFDVRTHQTLPDVLEQYLASAFRRSPANGTARIGICVRSDVPLKFDTVFRLGGGELEAGSYEVAVAGLIRTGAAALGVLDEDKGEWITIDGFDPTEYQKHLSFQLSEKTDVSFNITGNNVDPSEVDLELFDAGVARILDRDDQTNEFTT